MAGLLKGYVQPAGGGGAGSAPVQSVFGRIGAVVAVDGDYFSISQGGGSWSVASDGSLTATTAANKGLTLNGAASASRVIGTNGAITDTPAAGTNWTLASGDLVFGTTCHLSNEASNILALVNGTSQQGLLLYGTKTDGSNDERGFARWGNTGLASAPEFSLGTEALGTGTRRNVVVPNTLIVRQPGGTAGTNEVQIYNDGSNSFVNNRQGNLQVYLQAANNLFGVYDSNGNQAFFAQITNLGGNVRCKLSVSGGGGSQITADATNNSGNNPLVSLGNGGIVLFGGGFAGSGDIGFVRSAAGVVGLCSGATGTGGGWFQNTAGRARVTADVTESAGTLTNIADLTITLKAGRKYTGRMSVKCINSTATEGLKFDFNGGTATMTSFFAAAGILASGGTDVVGTNISTSLSGAINFTTFTGESVVTFEISLVCNAAGTFIPRFSENTSAVGTATVRLGSWLWLEDSPN